MSAVTEPTWPVIIHQGLSHSDYAAILRQKKFKVRVSDGVVPGSIIFPMSGVAFMVLTLLKAIRYDPQTKCQELTLELIDRLNKLMHVHRRCYVLCLAQQHGTNEMNIFSLIQRRYLYTRLNLMHVHNADEAVQSMINISKTLCKPTSDILFRRLEAVVQEQLQIDYMTAALTHLGLDRHECEIIQDCLGSLNKLSMATREQLLDCSLDSATVSRILTFFQENIST